MKVIDLLNKIANGEEVIEDNDDLELIPDDELYEFNKYASLDKEHLDFNFRVLKDKINELVKEINEIRKEMK